MTFSKSSHLFVLDVTLTIVPRKNGKDYQVNGALLDWVHRPRKLLNCHSYEYFEEYLKRKVKVQSPNETRNQSGSESDSGSDSDTDEFDGLMISWVS